MIFNVNTSNFFNFIVATGLIFRRGGWFRPPYLFMHFWSSTLLGLIQNLVSSFFVFSNFLKMWINLRPIWAYFRSYIRTVPIYGTNGLNILVWSCLIIWGLYRSMLGYFESFSNKKIFYGAKVLCVGMGTK